MSTPVYYFKRKELERLRNLRPNVKWTIEIKRKKFFDQLYQVVKNWKVQLPDLRSIFQQDEIDFLLIQAVIIDMHSGQEFIRFVVRTGYKDRIDVPKDGNNPLLLRRTTAIHHAARKKFNDWENISELFKIYDRFDVNYVDDFGLTHFHAACIAWNCQDLIRKFLEQGRVDPNLIWPETGDSPLNLSVRYGGYESIEILLRNGADPNLANKNGLTSLHLSTTHSSLQLIELLFEICEDIKQPLQVNARDVFGKTPLHWALETGRIEESEVLMRNGIDPNLPDKDGSTPLHIICKERRHWIEVEKFLKVTDELNLQLQVDARDKLGRTPLQFAVARLMPRIVDWLLDHGADVSSFVLLPENEFTARFDSEYDNSICFKYNIESGALAILESLEKRGYEVKDYVLIIMKIFSRLKLFKKSTSFETHLYNDEEFVRIAKRIRISPRISMSDYLYNADILEFERANMETEMTPRVSLYDLIRLGPKEAEKIFTYREYSCLDFSCILLKLPQKYETHLMLCLYEKVARGFCRRWALKYFYDLIRYRLPILCCEKIIDQLTNEDLCNICFAATAQDYHKSAKILPWIPTMIFRRSRKPGSRQQIFVAQRGNKNTHLLGLPRS